MNENTRVKAEAQFGTARDFPVSVPVIIIGAGACGLITALATHDAGVEALVLERDAQPSGSAALSSGFIPAARVGRAGSARPKQRSVNRSERPRD